MTTSTPPGGTTPPGPTASEPQRSAAGMRAVAVALRTSLAQMGPVRAARTLLRVNQADGFDCMGCAWPEGEHRHAAEFCENGAKAIAHEATRRRVGDEFFRDHPLSDLLERDDHFLEQQGRLTRPMLRDEGSDHYRPVSWDEAIGVVTDELRALEAPDQAVFYTSGRTSNEAAFLYQLLARGLGTNNLPDCSNMCHESSGSALTETIGVGKGTVSLEDLHAAELILVVGQNPGTNHPRMLADLERAKRNGATIVSINPLPEAGLIRFRNPQRLNGLFRDGTALADDHLPIRLGGDQALFQALGKTLVELDGRHGGVLDHEFIATFTTGIDEYLSQLHELDWEDVLAATGLDRAQIERTAQRLAASRRTVVCWAMGLTQHRHSVATLRDLINLLLLQGNIGKPGAGVCPVRGHSNVQGDRTMGIYERMPDAFHDALDAEFSFRSPRRPGYDTVGAIRAMRDGHVRVFLGMGGNFARAAPDSEATERALRNTRLTVHVSTTLNRSHLVTGARGLILPTLGRTDRDRRRTGDQVVTVEDSMSRVHATRGRLRPPSDDLPSEVAIVCRLGSAVLADGGPNRPQVDWAALAEDYSLIRRHIAAVVPGFGDFEQRIRGDGFVLPNGPRDARSFSTASGRATFTANPLHRPHIAAGRLLLQTIRSHDQYNTTIYGMDDRYRGIHGGRRVVLVNAADLRDLGIGDGDCVDVVSEFDDGVERRATGFRAVAYPTPRGNAAAYYPETNVLVPLDSTAVTSGTPTSKSVVIRLERRQAFDGSPPMRSAIE